MFDTARPHYEAIIGDIAKHYGWTQRDLREEIKGIMMDLKVIKFSTTELSDEQLEKFADRLHVFYHEQTENLPPELRSSLNEETLKRILF